MKTMIQVLVKLALPVALVVGCGSDPSPSPTPQPEPEPAATQKPAQPDEVHVGAADPRNSSQSVGTPPNAMGGSGAVPHRRVQGAP